MMDCKPLSVPIVPHIKLFDGEESRILISDSSLYRSLDGKLLYHTSFRKDIAYSIQSLSQFLHAPRISHFEAVKRVFRYLKHTSSHGLLFPTENSLDFKGYSE